MENIYNHPTIPPPTIQPKVQEKLFLTCTTIVPFYDPSGKMYVQIDGISMGSPHLFLPSPNSTSPISKTKYLKQQ